MGTPMKNSSFLKPLHLSEDEDDMYHDKISELIQEENQDEEETKSDEDKKDQIFPKMEHIDSSNN